MAIFLNMSIGDIQFAMATAVIMLIVALILMSVFKVFNRTGVRYEPNLLEDDKLTVNVGRFSLKNIEFQWSR